MYLVLTSHSPNNSSGVKGEVASEAVVFSGYACRRETTRSTSGDDSPLSSFDTLSSDPAAEVTFVLSKPENVALYLYYGNVYRPKLNNPFSSNPGRHHNRINSFSPRGSEVLKECVGTRIRYKAQACQREKIGTCGAPRR